MKRERDDKDAEDEQDQDNSVQDLKRLITQSVKQQRRPKKTHNVTPIHSDEQSTSARSRNNDHGAMGTDNRSATTGSASLFFPDIPVSAMAGPSPLANSNLGREQADVSFPHDKKGASSGRTHLPVLGISTSDSVLPLPSEAARRSRNKSTSKISQFSGRGGQHSKSVSEADPSEDELSLVASPMNEVLNQNVIPTPTAAETATGVGSFFTGFVQNENINEEKHGSGADKAGEDGSENKIGQVPKMHVGPGVNLKLVQHVDQAAATGSCSSSGGPALIEDKSPLLAATKMRASIGSPRFGGTAGPEMKSTSIFEKQRAAASPYAKPVASSNKTSPFSQEHKVGSIFGGAGTTTGSFSNTTSTTNTSSTGSSIFSGGMASGSFMSALADHSGGFAALAKSTSAAAEQSTKTATSGATTGGSLFSAMASGSTTIGSAVPESGTKNIFSTFASASPPAMPSGSFSNGASMNGGTTATGSSMFTFGTAAFGSATTSGAATSQQGVAKEKTNERNAFASLLTIEKQEQKDDIKADKNSSKQAAPSLSKSSLSAGAGMGPGIVDTTASGFANGKVPMLTKVQAVSRARAIVRRSELNAEAPKDYLLFAGNCKAFELSKNDDTTQPRPSESTASSSRRWRQMTDAGQVKISMDSATGAVSVLVLLRGTLRLVLHSTILTADSIKPVGDNSVCFMGTGGTVQEEGAGVEVAAGGTAASKEPASSDASTGAPSTNEPAVAPGKINGTTTKTANKEKDGSTSTIEPIYYRLNLLSTDQRDTCAGVMKSVCEITMSQATSSGAQ
ncbi:unnamed protein product [Amoebophrya sp. A120]|nr:unnamed protein product [Amoebophrya sp. A120]|eukprot:GSA120T00021417001.1